MSPVQQKFVVKLLGQSTFSRQLCAVRMLLSPHKCASKRAIYLNQHHKAALSPVAPAGVP